ncbi:alkaline phosphatase [Aliagarivorans marinus]|uniref:alkaline phosphatase n=1 Tax=Aliagarivorans marinus TaxID=561965 RepID=UPI0003FA835C|nr:alkaline phosphatase [Aliagarivorans marinus]
MKKAKLSLLYSAMAVIGAVTLVGCGSDTEYVYVDRDGDIVTSIDTGPYACTEEELLENANKDCRLYIKGSMNGWSAPPNAQLHYQGDGLHIALFGMEQGSYEFKISDPEWSNERDLAIGADEDKVVTIDTLYNLQRKFDDYQNQNMTFVVDDAQEQVFRFTLDASEAAGGIDNPNMYIENITDSDTDNLTVPVYLVGDFNDWEVSQDYQFEYQGAGNYQVLVYFEAAGDIQFNFQQGSDSPLVYGALKDRSVNLGEGVSALTSYPGGKMNASVEQGNYVFNISMLGDGQVAVPVSMAKMRAVSGHNKLTAPLVATSVGADGSSDAESYDWQVSGDAAVTLLGDETQTTENFRKLAKADAAGSFDVTLTTNAGTKAELVDSHSVDVIDLLPTKNVILMIGDGMGDGALDVSRAYLGETLFMERGTSHGRSKTASADTLGFEQLPGIGENYYTDSAAAATALSTGRKVNNGVVSLAYPGDGSPLQTILEYAQLSGRSGGIVATSHCVHATPAGFASHGPNRNDFVQLSASMYGDVQPNVTLCGAKQVSGVDVISQAANDNDYIVANNNTDMQAKLATLPASDADAEILFAGIFGVDEIPYISPNRYQREKGWSYESLDIPSLPEMSLTAIDILSKNPNGFFLMIEGSQIDFAAHNNDIDRVIEETLDFDDAVAAVVEWAKADGETLVIVTADHETGGLELIRNNGKGERPQVSWSTGDHTNSDVSIFSWGVNKQVFNGHIIDNTSINNIMRGAFDAE